MEIPQELVSIGQGLIGSAIGVYVSLKISLAALRKDFDMLEKSIEKRFGAIEDRNEVLGKRSHAQNEDLLIHDIELDDLMRAAHMPRKKRQNWRFEA